MKIFITGRAGGGKSTLARQFSKEYGIPHYETDDLAYDNVKNRMKTEKELDRIIDINQKRWVIEGAYIVPKYVKVADKVIYIQPNIIKSTYRIIKRYFTTPSVRKQYTLKSTLRLCRTTIQETFKTSTIKEKDIATGFYSEADRLAIIQKLAKTIEYIK